LSFTAFCFSRDANENSSGLKWTNRNVNTASDVAIHAAFKGVADNTFIIAGGMGHDRQFSCTAYIYDNLSSQWFIEPNTICSAYGASAANGDNLYCIGGYNENGPQKSVIQLRWDKKEKILEKKILPSLPHNLSCASAAVAKNILYVFGGYKDSDSNAASDVWCLDLKSNGQWQKFSDLPEDRCFSAAVVQNKGDNKCLYVFGGKDSIDGAALNDGFYYDLGVEKNKAGWVKIRDLPLPVENAAAINFGQSSIFLFDTAQKKLLSYHTVTDSWITLGSLPKEINEQNAINVVQNKIVILSLNGNLHESLLAASQGFIKSLDYAAIIFYFAILIGIGIYFSRHESNTEDFFLGGRKIPWWAAGVSLLATQVSSIGFMAIPAKTFSTDWLYFGTILTWFITVPIVTHFYLPFFRTMKVATAYEYLEFRFNSLCRMFGSLLFCFMMLARMAIVLYLPALALAAVTGINEYLCIAVVGIISTIYTAMGGVKAVIWTDVIQVILMMGSIIVCIFLIMFTVDGGPASFFDTAIRYNKFHTFRWDWDMTAASIGVIFIGSLFSKIASMTSDQTIVQRYASTTTKKQTIKSLWVHVGISIPWAAIVFLFGTALFVYYHSNPEKLSPTISNDSIVPWFISQGLPMGVSGLVIAGIFAAAQSTLSGTLNSVTMAIVTDFYKKFKKDPEETHMLKIARISTYALGIFSTASAMMMAFAGIRSLWDFFIAITGLFAGGLAGLFALGIFTTRTNAAGALFGVISSGILLVFVQKFNIVHLLLYGAVGFIWCFVAGYLASFFFGKKKENLDGLTYFTRRKEDV